MRPVLMVAYYYPPAGGAGVQRTLKFSRYLPRHGWSPHLLLPRSPDYPVADASLVDEIPPEATLHRTRIVEPYALYRRLSGRQGSGSLDVATSSRSLEESRRPGERIAEWLRRAFFIPDARVGWLPFAEAGGMKVVSKVRPAALYSTAPPYTCHVIGWRLHRRTGLPWVADFRDSWVGWPSAAQRRGLARRVDIALEGAVLRAATCRIAVSQGVARDLQSRHPDARDNRWRIIPNGFDPEDLTGVAPDRAGVPASQLLLTHTGTLYGPRDPETLVRALETLAEEGHPCAAAIRVRLVGRVASTFRSRIAQGRAASLFEVVDYVDHRRAIALTAASDAALLIVDQAPQSAGILTGKLFEYLGLRRPILALAPDGEAADLVRTCAAGWQVRPGDVDEMRRRLIAMWEMKRSGALAGPTAESVKRFERQAQTAELAGILDTISERADRSGASAHRR